MRLSVADSAGAVREFGKELILVDALSKLELVHEEIRAAMFRYQELIRGQIQIIDVGDYGEYGAPDYWGRMYAGLKDGPELYKVFDLNYPETVRTVFLVR